MKQRRDAVKLISAAFSDDVDYRSRRLSKLGLVAGRENLKLGNCLLVKLCGGPAVDSVLVRLSIDEKIVITASLAQHRVGVVAGGLPVDSDSRHELHQIKVVTTVDRHVQNLSRHDRRSSRGRRRINQQLSVCGDIDLAALDRAYCECNVQGQSFIDRQFHIIESLGSEARL